MYSLMLVSRVSHNDLTFAFPSGSAVKNLPAMQDSQKMWVWSLGWKGPLEEGTSIFLPGESHGQMSLARYSPWGCKQSDTAEMT